MRNSFKDFFAFSKKELNGLLVLGAVLLLIIFAPLVYYRLHPPEAYNYSAFIKEIENFRASSTTKKFNNYEAEDAHIEEVPARELFRFNPNGLTVSEWKRLGLSLKQIKVIKNYESKGGRFYSKEDLKKIYSIQAEDYARLEPFISIPEKHNDNKNETKNAYKKPVVRRINIIDINTADSTQFESLNGIGPAFASRIIKYRNRLGGFCKKEQLKEVYGLDSAVYHKLENQITLNRTSIKQIPVNIASFEDLKHHPYLSYKQMNAIIRYRKQHGDYKDINDLKAISILNDDVLNKVAPYLSFRK